ncbi:TRAP transporter small permease [Pseudodesulfovibrio sediminis]|uniref:2,3-diketo-L-gulonate TRAP transporter small permease YiaM n=1 Tax=Pseudodesulfovibrio sediminis TaxID=2810563 RepID=A0ABN6EXI5_9BACT|nr:TRAP transporter small permease [Pseudodesulfovibrio sediminis]BCS89890.1 2,3-diketo-L-gulonate TRAP transporter small permease YiaM [Pseudodesulfovibrio sediminis]
MKKLLFGFRLDHWLVAICMATMVGIAFINILSRYIFHFSLAATEEITINLFVWMTVIGIAIAFERGGHMGMVTFFNMFPKALKKVSIVIYSLLAAALFLVLDYFMIQAIYDEITLFQARSASLDIPVWIYYLGLPVFSVFIFRGIYKDAMTKLTGQEKE